MSFGMQHPFLDRYAHINTFPDLRSLRNFRNFNLSAAQKRFITAWSNPITYIRYSPLLFGLVFLLIANGLLLYRRENRLAQAARIFFAVATILIGFGGTYIAQPKSFVMDMAFRAIGIQLACIAASMHIVRGRNPPTPQYRDFTGIPMPKEGDWINGLLYAIRLTCKVRMEDFDTSVVDARRFTGRPWLQWIVTAGVTTVARKMVESAEVRDRLGPFLTDVVTFFYGFGCLHAGFILMNFFIPMYRELPIFERHFLTAPSLPRFWSHHWHQLWGHPIRYLGFKPGRALTGGSRWGGWIGAMAFSGFFHWFIVFALQQPGLPFRTFLYFTLQGVFMGVDSAIWGASPKGETPGERSNDPTTRDKVSREEQLDRWISSLIRRAFLWATLLIPGALLIVPYFPPAPLKAGAADINWLVQNFAFGEL
ncbi:hypothetical protein PYCC9005_001682 [Savitreella phatthalungensis]